MRLLFVLPIIFTSQIALSDQPEQLETLLIHSGPSQHQALTLHPVNLLKDQELLLKQSTTLGGTLQYEPGIHNSSFGANVGRPVIRGQYGNRVQILQNGLGSLDVSSISPDHAITTESSFADQVEVLRGPASLLYGSGAIGGVINVINQHIPDKLIESAETNLEQRYHSATDGWTSALKHQNSHENLAWHLSGFFRDHNDYAIPSAAQNQDHVENTASQSWNANGGVSWINDHTLLGFSVEHLDNQYGVPPVLETVRIELKQTRYDIKAELYDPTSWIELIKLRLGYNDYEHAELESGIELATLFENQGFESRLEILHNELGLFDRGVMGVQIQYQDFSATGEEAYLPSNRQENYAFFAVESLTRGSLSYELGFRAEHQALKASGFKKQQHTPFNASISTFWKKNQNLNMGLSFSFAQRAPNNQELFSNGVHFATQGFEIGNPNLQEETSFNLDLNLGLNFKYAAFKLNLFHNWNQDYIFLQTQPEQFDLENEQISNSCIENCIAVFKTFQQDARFYGFESDLSIPVWQTEPHQFTVNLFTDYVRGKLNTGGLLPRLPPLRYGLELDYKYNDKLNSIIYLAYSHSQNDVAINETKTNGFLTLNTQLYYHTKLTGINQATLFIKTENLLNQTIRQSTSFLRDVAPEKARSVEVGVRLNF